MIKALLVEDERMARTQLARILSANFPDIEVAGMTDSVASTVDYLRSNPMPDVIFMDVELLDGECFEIFRQVEVRSQVIMTTAYDSYAVKAFETGSIDYLLKPISLEALHRAVGRCRERLSHTDVAALLEALGQAAPDYLEHSTVKSGDRIIPIDADEIAYFFSEDKANYLMTFRGEKYIIESTIEQLESGLNPEDFFRISRGCIVNRRAVASASRHISGRLLVSATPAAPFEMTVSRARVDDFVKWLK